MKIKAKIYHTVKETHPDIQNMPEKDWKGREFTYEDVYTFDHNWDLEKAIAFMKHDLELIAGGGYNTRHIDNIRFEFKEVK